MVQESCVTATEIGLTRSSADRPASVIDYQTQSRPKTGPLAETYPFGSTTTVTSGVIPVRTLTATL
jgi:hypothetical protein